VRVGDVLIGEAGADARPCGSEMRLGVVEVDAGPSVVGALRPAKVAAPRPLRGLPGVASLARMIRPMAMPRQITSKSSGWRWPAITVTRRDRVSEASVIWCIAGRYNHSASGEKGFYYRPG
jgi:hypothetical protein